MKYTFRKSAFTKTQTFNIKDNFIEISSEAANSAPESIPLEKIAEVKLAYNSSVRAMPETYFTTVTLDRGRKIDLKSVHFLSYGNFEDRSQSYSNFVKELHRSLVPYNQVKFKSGVSVATLVFSYFILALSFVAFFVGLALMAYGLPVQGALFTLVVTFLGNKLRKYIAVNKPQNYSPDSIPEAMLPS